MPDSLISPDQDGPVGPSPVTEHAELAMPEAPPPVQSHDELPAWARETITKANKEAADYRGELRAYQDVFGQMDPTTRDDYLRFIKLSTAATAGDEAAIAELTEAGLWEAPEPEPEGDQPAYLTRAEFDAALAERDSRAAEAANMGYLHAEARKLGYEPGTVDYHILTNVADQIGKSGQAIPAGKTLLDVAHEQIEARDRERFEKLVGRKTLEARDSLTLPGTSGTPNLPAPPPGTRQELRQRAYERLQQG